MPNLSSQSSVSLDEMNLLSLEQIAPAIRALSEKIANRLKENLKSAFIDADHKSSDDQSNLDGSFLNYGHLEYIDKIDFQRIDLNNELNDFQYKSVFNEQELIIVNGNHFLGKHQILVLDPKKSLEKKLDRLTNVKLILKTEPDVSIPEFLSDYVSNDTPQFQIDDIKSITEWIRAFIKKNTPTLNGLVLSGGRSVRMNKDKTSINYHGIKQRDYMHQLLETVCSNTYYSIREDQRMEFENQNVIADRFLNLGAYGAILSAFMHDPNKAWLVTASDQPYLTENTLEYLVRQRNPAKVATCFYNPETEFPEPLVTIWEPRAYPIMLQYLSQGFSCPRKVLINSNIELVKLEDASVLDNVNTPEEYQEALERLNK